MNRNDKIAKLDRAVRDWRGAWDAKRQRWIRTPNMAAVPRVGRWLAELGLDTVESFVRLNQFKSVDEFNAWLKKI